MNYTKLLDSAGIGFLIGLLWKVSNSLGHIEGQLKQVVQNDIPHIYEEIQNLRNDFIQHILGQKIKE